jgi:hypothetical protein
MLVPELLVMMNGRQWSDEVRQRCFVLWSGRGNHNACRTRWLLRQDAPDDAPIPGASTIRRWAAEEGWAAWAGESQPPLPRQNRARWMRMACRRALRQVESALTAQRALLLGTFDADPAASAEALTTAASMEQLLAQPGVRALLRAAFREEEAPPVFVATRERQAWERLVQRKTEAYRYQRQP